MEWGSDDMERKMDWQQLLTEKRYNTSNIFYLRGESAYNIDSMKIIKSEAFQKLPEKSHLFPIEGWDYSRSSMVHSLEVSYFSKMIVHKFAERNMRKTVTAKEIAKMSNTVCAAALIQEIGLPAFGYCGEACIRGWFQENLATLTYEGKKLVELMNLKQCQDLENLNVHAQSLRILRKLHGKARDKKMNLTYAILNTVVNQPVKELANYEAPYLSCYQSEQAFCRNIFEEVDIINKHPLSLIVSAASDLAYTTSAIKDGLSNGVIDSQQIVCYLQEKIDENKLTYGQLFQYREVLGRHRHFSTKAGQDEEAVVLWLEDTQLRFINNLAASFNRKYALIMSGNYHRDLFHETDVEPLFRGLQGFVEESIICHPQRQASELVGMAKLTDLLNRFVPATLYYDEERTDEQRAINQRISIQAKKAYRDDLEGIADRGEGDKLYYRLLMVVDFLTELTDRQAASLSEELVNLEAISL